MLRTNEMNDVTIQEETYDESIIPFRGECDDLWNYPININNINE